MYDLAHTWSGLTQYMTNFFGGMYHVPHRLTIPIHIHWLKIKQNGRWKPQVIDKSMPVFSKQFFSDIIPENMELHSPLSAAIQAESPLGRKLIYTIVKGNELEEFAVDFNTGMNLINFLFNIVFFLILE